MQKDTKWVDTNLSRHYQQSRKFPHPLKKKRKAYKIIIIISEDEMDTSNNDFQVELRFGFRALKTTFNGVWHIFKCRYIFSCLCHFQSADIFLYIFLKRSWLLKIHNWPFPKLKLRKVINSRSENEKFAS